MISNDKTRWIYIREILNLECLAGPQDFGRGVKIIPLSEDVRGLIDKYIPQLNIRYYNKQYWIINCEPLSKSSLIDGDPAGGLRFLPVIMLIVVSPYLKFGPSCFLKIEEGNREVVGVSYDQLETIMAHMTPDDFVILDNANIKELREFFENFLDNLFAKILDISRDRFVRACLDKKEDDGIIDLSIALESLYGGNKDNIARYGASFIAMNAQEREIIYADLATFWARNKIMHEGVAFPRITLENGRLLDTKEIRHCGFLHCARAIRKMVENPFWQGKSKREVLNHYENLARPLKNELDMYRQKYQSVTRRRNS